MATLLGHFEDSYGNIVLPTPHSYTSVIETSLTASQAYVVGELVTIVIPGGLNHLYRVKQPITLGDTFSVGTNIEIFNVAILNEMLTASDGTVFTLQDYLDGNYD